MIHAKQFSFKVLLGLALGLTAALVVAAMPEPASACQSCSPGISGCPSCTLKFSTLFGSNSPAGYRPNMPGGARHPVDMVEHVPLQRAFPGLHPEQMGDHAHLGDRPIGALPYG